jgi:hypothetical protein
MINTVPKVFDWLLSSANVESIRSVFSSFSPWMDAVAGLGCWAAEGLEKEILMIITAIRARKRIKDSNFFFSIAEVYHWPCMVSGLDLRISHHPAYTVPAVSNNGGFGAIRYFGSLP